MDSVFKNVISIVSMVKLNDRRNTQKLYQTSQNQMHMALEETLHSDQSF